MDLTNFVFSIIASIIATYLITILGFLKGWFPFRFIKTYTDVGVVKIFKNQESAIMSIKKDLNNSKTIRVLAVKGNTFSNPNKETNPLYEEVYNKDLEQKYLISSLINPYLHKRATELRIDNFNDSVELSIKNFLSIKKRQNKNKFKIRLHDEVVRFRIIILDDYLYLSFQENNIPGKNTSVIKIRSTSSIYKSFSILFDDLWEKYEQSEVQQIE